MNEGKVDRIVRAILGIIALLIAFFAVGGAAQIILWIIGGVLLLTAATGFCLFYLPFHYSTRRRLLTCSPFYLTVAHTELSCHLFTL